MSDEKGKRERGSPKGLYVNLTEDMKQEIEERCEESLRTPGAEVAWIVRAYLSLEADSRSGKTTEMRPSAATG